MFFKCNNNGPVQDFDLYRHADIPLLFLKEQYLSPVYNNYVDSIIGCDYDSDNLNINFLLPFLALQKKLFLNDLYINCLYMGLSKTLLNSADGIDSLRHALLAINTLFWVDETKEENQSQVCKNKINEFLNPEFYKSEKQGMEYIKLWLEKFINMERFNWMIDAMFNKEFNETPQYNITEIDMMISKILYDVKTYGIFSILSHSYSRQNVKDSYWTYIFSNLFTYNLIRNNISGINDLINLIKSYYLSESIPKPQSDFVKKKFNKNSLALIFDLGNTFLEQIGFKFQMMTDGFIKFRNVKRDKFVCEKSEDLRII